MGFQPLLLVLLLAGLAFGDTGYRNTIAVTETDNTPACTVGLLKFSTGILSCSGQTATVTPIVYASLNSTQTWTAPQTILSSFSVVGSTTNSVIASFSTSTVPGAFPDGVWISTTGYVGIGTTTPGYKLDAKEILGSELITNGSFTGNANGWTLNSGWTYSSNAVNKDGDGVGTLAQSLAAVAGTVYKIVFTISSWTVGTVRVTFGATNMTYVAASGTYTFYVKALTTGSLTFTPSSTARFTIDDISIKIVTPSEVHGTNLISDNEIKINAYGSDSSNPAGQIIIKNASITGQDPTLQLIEGGGNAYVSLNAYNITASNSMTAGLYFTSGLLYFFNKTLGLTGDAMLGWASSTTPSATKDTGLSRSAAGVVAVGTGAIGNSTGTILTGSVAISSSGANSGVVESRSPNSWDLGYTATPGVLGTSVLQWDSSPAVNVSSSMTVTGVINASGTGAAVTVSAGSLRLYSRSSAQIKAITPAAVGEYYYCNDCTTVTTCVSTGAVVGAFALITAKTSACQ